MTIEEKLREEGRKEGRKEGREELQDKATTVIEKLKKQFGEKKIDVDLTIKIMKRDIKELDEIEEAINEAKDFEEIKEMIA